MPEPTVVLNTRFLSARIATADEWEAANPGAVWVFQLRSRHAALLHDHVPARWRDTPGPTFVELRDARLVQAESRSSTALRSCLGITAPCEFGPEIHPEPSERKKPLARLS
jgi:hypothetical protein